jgi:hypothetical protein
MSPSDLNLKPWGVLLSAMFTAISFKKTKVKINK